tara:strand:- start:196 stop:468 length:273 start_codon:yes stop_codon:yes gene_type:complete
MKSIASIVVRPKRIAQATSVGSNMEEDKINPSYYKKGIETTDYIVSHNMNYVEGNIIKYVTRYKEKNGLQDLLKAEWYLNRLIKETRNNG